MKLLVLIAIFIFLNCSSGAGKKSNESPSILKSEVVKTIEKALIVEGTSGNNTLNGTNQADTITGAAGNDRLYGRGGNDILYADNAPDESNEEQGDFNNDKKVDGSDFLNWQRGYGNDKNDQDLENWSNNYGNNVLINFTHVNTTTSDTLYGGAGDDTLYSGRGNDKLYGESGADTFVPTFASEVIESTLTIVSDFNMAEGDKFDISHIINYDGGSISKYVWFVESSNFSGHHNIMLVDIDGDRTYVGVIYFTDSTGTFPTSTAPEASSANEAFLQQLVANGTLILE